MDGLEFRWGKCGFRGMGGDCCYTYSKVIKEGNTLIYESKDTAPTKAIILSKATGGAAGP